MEHRPRQIEFARFNLTHAVTRKRELRPLIEAGAIDGRDDPRLPTLYGMRRRGYPPEGIRRFCDEIGASKRPQMIELSRLEHDVRDVLNRKANRVMGVLDPLKVTVTNYEGGEEHVEAINNPEDESAGTREVPFSGELWIERDDFLEDPPRKFKRLSPGVEVRLRYGCFIRCDEVIKDKAGRVVELRCTYDPTTRGGNAPDGRKPKGTIHWVSAAHALDAEVRQYDHLFLTEDPDADAGDVSEQLNPDSLITLTGCKVEPSCADIAPGVAVQFERHGYFCLDARPRAECEGSNELIFHRTATLRDTWARMQQAGRAG